MYQIVHHTEQQNKTFITFTSVTGAATDLFHYKWQWIDQYIWTLYVTGHQQTQHLTTCTHITKYTQCYIHKRNSATGMQYSTT